MAVRRLAQEQGGSGEGSNTWHIHVCSRNNFPTAAGLASSAAGYACLAYTLKELYSVKGDITAIARQGSGSACRSLHGGFVRWHKGSAADGTDSVAKQIAPSSHWPELRILILVVTNQKKLTSSTFGMQRSVETSELLKYRVSHCVPDRVEAMVEAIKNKDFETFAEITMKDSNQFHAIGLDTYPPAVYMNDVSHTIARVVHRYNCVKGANKVAYTFDAGPNACLYMLESEVPAVLGLMKHIFPPRPEHVQYVRGLKTETQSISQEVLSSLGVEPQQTGLLMEMILTKLGEGPERLTDPKDHLLTEGGLPK
ncbi:diphosphomevalonate decarboxylase isoform X2 [Anabrus simplex]|uniref:diphosphomevalonate decarboxylase isoform X2 n=1 Tax=Anabrus simplex TaxID=316456 RepID=UPI0035A35A91